MKAPNHIVRNVGAAVIGLIALIATVAVAAGGEFAVVLGIIALPLAGLVLIAMSLHYDQAGFRERPRPH